MPSDPLTPERLEAIRARLAAATRNWDGVQAVHGDVLHRTSPGDRLRLNTPTSWAVGPEARGTPGGAQADADLIAAAPTDLRDLLAEVGRLQAEVDRLKAEIQPRIERSIAFQEAMEEAEAERDEARAEVERLKELRQRGCDCSDEDACRFARERDEAQAEVTRLQAEVTRLQAAAHRAGQEAMRSKTP